MPRPAPVAPAPQRTNHRKADPKDNRSATQIDARRRRKCKGRVCNPWPTPIDNDGIVVRHVNDIGTDRLHDDLVILLPDSLFGCRFQRALGDGEFAQPLNGIHDVTLLREKGVTDLLGPLQIALHHLQRVRERHERLYAEVPVLMLQCSRECVASQCGVRRVFQPMRRFDDFEWISRSRENLSHEGIGI